MDDVHVGLCMHAPNHTIGYKFIDTGCTMYTVLHVHIMNFYSKISFYDRNKMCYSFLKCWYFINSFMNHDADRLCTLNIFVRSIYILTLYLPHFESKYLVHLQILIKIAQKTSSFHSYGVNDLLDLPGEHCVKRRIRESLFIVSIVFLHLCKLVILAKKELKGVSYSISIGYKFVYTCFYRHWMYIMQYEIVFVNSKISLIYD